MAGFDFGISRGISFRLGRLIERNIKSGFNLGVSHAAPSHRLWRIARTDTACSKECRSAA